MIYKYYICMCFMSIYLSSIKIEMKGKNTLKLVNQIYLYLS